MFSYEIMTYGGGNVLNGVFEAIARMRGAGAGGSVFGGLIVIAVLVGYVQTLIINAARTNIKGAVYWALGWMVFLGLLYVPTVPVVIVDKSLNHAKPIDHVPFGIALFASITSQMSELLTQEFEKQFSVPDNHQSYRKHGLLFSQSLVTAASQFEVVNPTIERNFRNFARQCVLYDVRIGSRYSLEDLLYAPNAWELIKSRTSRLRLFDYENAAGHRVKPCLEGAVELDRDLDQEAERHKKVLSWRFFNQGQASFDGFSAQKAALATQVIQNELGPAHAFLSNMSGDATSILKQHMVRNALKDSVIKNAQSVGANAAAQGFALARAKEQQRNTFQILGDLSGKALANLTIVFQAILYGSFMLIVLLAVQPNGFMILKKYLGLVLWVHAWPPLFAIINYIQTEELRSASIAAATFVDGQGAVATGWNLFTSPAIIQANVDVAALAGFYAISVPMIAIALVNGVHSFLNLASHLGSVTQGAAAQAGEEITTGNYSYGNISLDNYSADNRNANHWNTAASYTAMRQDFELSSGSTLSHTGDGKAVLNQSAGRSSLNTALNYDALYSAAVQEQSQQAQTALYTEGVHYANSVAAATATTLQIMQSGGFNTTENTTLSTQEAESIAQKADTVQQFQDSFARQHSLTQDQTAQIMAAAYAEVSIDSNKSIAGGFGSLIGISGSAGAKIEMQGMSSARQGELVQAAKDAMIANHLTESVDHLVRASKDMNFTSGNEQQTRLMDEHRANLDEVDRTERSYQSTLQKSENLSQMAQIIQNQGVGIHQDLQQFTFEKLSTMIDKNGQVLGASGVDRVLQDKETAMQYVEKIAAEDIQSLSRLYEKNALSQNDIENKYHDYGSGIKTTDTIKNKAIAEQDAVKKAAENLGVGDIYHKEVVGNQTTVQHAEIMRDASQKLEAKQKVIEGEVVTRQATVQKERDLKEEGLLNKSFKNAVDRVFDKDKKENER